MQQIDGIWALVLTPEAGTIKTGKARRIPLHSHLIEQGFLDFVKSRGNGPLFFEPIKGREDAEAINPRKPQSVMLLGELSKWVRSLGVKDPHVSPTHSWRHLFKQIAERHGISERISDAITGHAAATAGRAYGAPSVSDMAEALKRFPRYQV